MSETSFGGSGEGYVEGHFDEMTALLYLDKQLEAKRDRELVEHRERRISGSEIIEVHLYAELADRGERAEDDLGAFDDDTLGELDGEELWRERGCPIGSLVGQLAEHDPLARAALADGLHAGLGDGRAPAAPAQIQPGSALGGPGAGGTAAGGHRRH